MSLVTTAAAQTAETVSAWAAQLAQDHGFACYERNLANSGIEWLMTQGRATHGP
jgi:hypothetical protein